MKIITIESVGSTNSYLLEHPDLLAQNFLVLHAKKQTAGRGRYGRTWFSGGVKDLSFSFVYHPETSINLSATTVLAGIALIRALKSLTGAPLSIKWPNDIYFEERKLSGILVERVADDNTVVIGIGVNVNSKGSDLIASAVSMSEIAGKEFNVNEVLDSVIHEEKKILESAGFPVCSANIAEFCRYSNSIGRKVRYSGENGVCEGIVSGISDQCKLLIVTDGIQNEYAGEVEFII